MQIIYQGTLGSAILCAKAKINCNKMTRAAFTDLNGKKRELHTELAIESIDYQVYDEYCQHVEPAIDQEVEINRCEYFVATLAKIVSSYRIDVAQKDSFRIVVVTKGQGELADSNGNKMQLSQGDVILIQHNGLT